MKRKKIKIGDTQYILYEDPQCMYDGYVYDSEEVLDRKPQGTNVIGYILDSGQKIAVCKKSYDKFAPVIIGVCALGVVAVVGVSVVKLSSVTNVEVPHFSFNRDNVVEDLDDGTKKERDGFTYSEYGTYDGSNASLFINTKHKDATVKLVFDGVESNEVSVSDVYAIPIALDIAEQDIATGKLVYTRGNVTEEYPITLEYVSTAKPALALGDSTYDPEITITETTAYVQLEPSHAAPNETIANDINEYKESEVDFSNFNILTDDPDTSVEKQKLAREEEESE